MLWTLWLLVVPDQPRDQGTMSPIELFWTAKNTLMSTTSALMDFPRFKRSSNCVIQNFCIIQQPSFCNPLSLPPISASWEFGCMTIVACAVCRRVRDRRRDFCGQGFTNGGLLRHHRPRTNNYLSRGPSSQDASCLPDQCLEWLGGVWAFLLLCRDGPYGRL